MSQSQESSIDPNLKKGGKNCFSTALLLNLSPIHNTIIDSNEPVENLRLNTSASAIQADSSSIMNNCLSSDLMNRIDNLSPIKSKKAPIVKKISDICLVSCEEGKNLNVSGDSFELSCDFVLNEETEEPLKKKPEEKIEPVEPVTPIEDKKIDQIHIASDKEDADKKEKNEKFNLSWSKNSIHLETVPKNANVSIGSNLNSSQLLSYYNSTSKYFSHTLAEEKEKHNEIKLQESLNNSHNYIRKPISPSKNDKDFNSQINYFNKETPFNEYQYDNYFETTPMPNPLVNQQEEEQLPIQQPLNQYQPLHLQPQLQNPLQSMRHLTDSNLFSNSSLDAYERDLTSTKPMTSTPPLNYHQQQLQYQQQQNQYYAYMMMHQMNSNQFIPKDIQQEQYTSNFGLAQFSPQQQSSLTQPKPRKLKKPSKKKGKKKSGNEGSDNEEGYLLEMFGRIGWICSQCNNFNYETRNKCNRCGIQKTPKKLSEIKKKDPDDKKKKASDRKGDWVCGNCKNLNFSFRKICNRCQLPKEQSDMMPGTTNANSGQKPILPMNSFPYHFQMNLINNGQININYHNLQNNYNEEGNNNNENEDDDEEEGDENY